MFSKVFPKRMPSEWRMGILLTVFLSGSVALCIFMASWVLRGDLKGIANAVVMDDLGEYAVFYDRGGLEILRSVYLAGAHDPDQGVRVTSPAGQVLLEELPDNMRGYVFPNKPPKGLAKERMVMSSLRHPSSEQRLLLGSRLLADGNVLWFCRTDEQDSEHLAHVRNTLWLAGGVGAVLMLLPMYWFVRQVLSPVRGMIVSARTLAAGNTDERLRAPQAVPELRAFADSFNEGLDRIEALSAELQAANDNLAHELRTPLARIRGNLERLQSHTDNDDARDAAARGTEEIDRAASLIQTILTTRAGEHRALKLHLEMTDVRDLLQRLLELYVPAAEDRSLGLELIAPENPCVALLDRQRITQAVANLLDNALNYTPADGGVTLELSFQPASIRISVQDTGPGLREEELARVWRRHVRGSAASASVPGMGLGLSLVRAIANAHGGTTGCGNLPESGAEFWIELPLTVTA